MENKYNIIIQKGANGYYISEVIELPGCHTQAKSIDLLIKRTREAIELYLEVNKLSKNTESQFIGIQQISVSA